MLQFASNLTRRLHLAHRAWRYRLRVERPEVAFVRKYIKKGDIALDIGAHKGGFTYWMSKAVGATGRVIAFEPIPHLAEYLRENTVSGPLKNVTVVEAALSDAAGVKTLFIPEQGHLGTATLRQTTTPHRALQMQSFTLDQYCRDNSIRPISFIKCDVEGHEFELFQGGEKVLREDQPILLFECLAAFHPNKDVQRVFSFLQRLGYTGFFFQHERMAPIAEFRVELQQQSHCANFGFLPADKARR